MSEVERLRQEYRKRRSAVTSKITRTLKTTGAKVAGTKYDPRKPVGHEKRLNAAQLKTAISRMNEFTHRSTQFVGGTRGVPLPRHTFRDATRLASEARMAGERFMARLDQIDAPGGVTVAGNMAMKHPMANGGARGPYAHDVLEASQIPSEKALAKYRERSLKQLKSSYLDSRLTGGRERLDKALGIMGATSLQERLANMQDEAFEALWYGSTFAELTFMKYDVEKSRAAGTPKEEWQNKVVDDEFDNISEFFDWAETVGSGGETSENIKYGKR